MTVTNGYATLAELMAQIGATGAASFTADEMAGMETAIEAASRWIDAQTGTRFYAASETRYYTADWSDLLYIDDLLSVTTLATDDDEDGTYETTWAVTDYVLEPRNAALNGKPYRQIRYTPNGDYSFPRGVRDGVKVVGSFGYASAAPPVVEQACLLLAHRLWRRKDAIFGVAGTPALGVQVVQAKITADADIMALLSAVDVNRIWPR